MIITNELERIDSMEKQLLVRRRDGKLESLTLKQLEVSDIDQVMQLQEEIICGLEDQQIYAMTDREEFLEYFEGDGVLLGYLTEQGKLVALGVYTQKGYEPSNYGYDLELEGEALLKVGHVESTIVQEAYRGNGLQQKLCIHIEELAKVRHMQLLCATASPYNHYSVNTFKKLGYEIKKDKLKYGGLRRYVLAKSI